MFSIFNKLFFCLKLRKKMIDTSEYISIIKLQIVQLTKRMTIEKNRLLSNWFICSIQCLMSENAVNIFEWRIILKCWKFQLRMNFYNYCKIYSNSIFSHLVFGSMEMTWKTFFFSLRWIDICYIFYFYYWNSLRFLETKQTALFDKIY